MKTILLDLSIRSTAAVERHDRDAGIAKVRPKFHAAHYTGSPRLQNVLKILSDGAWHTGMDIAQGAGVLNPAGCVSELNAPINGLGIESRYVGENENERKVWKYRWLKREAA